MRVCALPDRALRQCRMLKWQPAGHIRAPQQVYMAPERPANGAYSIYKQ